MQQKQPTKAEMQKKVEAWKTINSVLVKANSDFMATLNKILADKQALMEELKVKIESKEGSEDDNAEYLFTGGYVQAIKDILGKANG